MYAKDLSLLLHRQLSESFTYEDTLKRFEMLRANGQLPRGRDKAGRRLTNEEIASAILGFAPTSSGLAGQVALIMGDLRPVGGIGASYQRAASLRYAVAAILLEENRCCDLVSLTFSIARAPGKNSYRAEFVFEEDGHRKRAAYVSKYSLSLTADGAEETYDHDRPLSTNTRQLVLDPVFFRELKRKIDLSRSLDRPLETDWREYNSEEEREAFHKRLGARRDSRFLNLGVDTNVTWPMEPTRIEFGGHQFVLFPKTKEHSYSISIDLHGERITEEDAISLFNRFLSLLSWCDDQHAILREGWSGNPVPVPVPRRDLGIMTMSTWIFCQTMPSDGGLLNSLSYYREGLNAAETGIPSQEILSFFKAFEEGRASEAVRRWIEEVFVEACVNVPSNYMQQFHSERCEKAIGPFVFENYRVASAHASRKFPSDADKYSEARRLHVGAQIMRALARHFIRTKFHLSDSYMTDEYVAQ